MARQIEKFFTLGETLGSGTFSVVRVGINKKTSEKVAIKVIDKKTLNDKADMIQSEVEILKKITHPNIVLLKDLFETPTHIYLVMELVTGGELFDRIVDRGSYSEKDASKIVRDILNSVHYLHQRKIVHRDLKPENLLFATEDANAIIKIADFGLSTFVGNENMLKTACGTPGYVAPEVLLGMGYSFPVDLWSVGVIMYILLCGFPPFYEENIAVLFEQIIEGSYGFPDPYWTNISESAKDLIRHLMDVDSTTRYTAEQALKHPWIVGATAGTTDIAESVLTKMKEFNAKRRFKTAILATIATGRMKAM
jgi:calcium/calmodulin-dependent protein kinase I